jgi:hypothetical protein
MTTKFDVTSSDTSPHQFMFQSKQKTNLYYGVMKGYFVVNMDNLDKIDHELSEKNRIW